MDTLQLKLFLSLAKTLNFTKTANEFYVTQPTVSNYIKALENGMGVTLLKRDSHSVSLTPEGKEFMGYATQMLALQTEAENRLRNIAEGRRGYIRIAMLSSTVEMFSACLEEFVRRYPGVQVNVDMLEGSEMITAFSQCSYDIYFAHEHMVSANENIEYFIVEKAHLNLFVNRDIVSSIDMSDWKTIAPYHFAASPETGFSLSGQIKRICMNRGVVPDIINYYNRADTVLLAVNCGVGIAILPPQLKNLYNLPNIVALPIDGSDAVINYVVAWNRGSGNPEVQKFLGVGKLASIRRK